MKKELYTFKIQVEKPVKETTKQTVNGEEIEVTKTVKQLVPRSVVIYRPTRSQRDDAEMAYNKKYNRCINDGILTRSMLIKRYADNGGIFTKAESERFQENERQIIEGRVELEKIYGPTGKFDDSGLTEEQKTKAKEIVSLMSDAMAENARLESFYQPEFAATADEIAAKERVLFYVLSLSHWDKDGKTVPLFEGKTHEERYKSYCEKEDSDDDKDEYIAYVKSFTKISYILAYYNAGRAKTKEDFDKIISDIDERLEPKKENSQDKELEDEQEKKGE